MHRAYAAYAALIVPRLGRCCQGRCQGFAPPCCCCQLATDVRIHWLPLAHESRGTTDRIPSRGYSGTGAKYAAVAAPRLPCRWFGLNESLFERTGGILAIKRLTGAARSPRRLLPGLSNQNGFYRLTIHCFCQFHRGYVSICISDMSLLTLATLLANFVRAAEHGHNTSKNNAKSWTQIGP